MLIVDAQVHIWGQGLPTNPAHRQVSAFSKDDLLNEMDAAGVDAAVIHPPIDPTRIKRGGPKTRARPPMPPVRGCVEGAAAAMP